LKNYLILSFNEAAKAGKLREPIWLSNPFFMFPRGKKEI
jgi:hypothetical protein